MSKNTKPGVKSKGQDKIEQSAYINQIAPPKQAKEDAQLEGKIEAVQSVTKWPREDIKRVLEDCLYDTQKAITNILDGVAGNPTEEWRTVNKRSAKETKEQHKPSQGERQDRRGNNSNSNTKRSSYKEQDGNRRQPKPRNENHKESTTPTSTPPQRQNAQPKEHQPDSQKPQDKEHRPIQQQQPPLPSQPQQQQQTPQQPVQHTPTPVTSQQKSQASPPPQATTTSTTTAPPTTVSPTTSQAQKVAQAQPPGKPQPTPVTPPAQQPVTTPTNTVPTTTATTTTTSPTPTTTVSPTPPNNAPYRPSHQMWKPKNTEQPASPAPVTQATPQQQSTPQIAPSNAVVAPPSKSTSAQTVQQQQQQGSSERNQVSSQASTSNPSTAAVYGQTLYSVSPVILPQTYKANQGGDIDFTFGSLVVNDYSSSTTSSSTTAPSNTETQYIQATELSVQGKVNSSLPAQTYIDSDRMEHIRMPGQYMAPSLETEAHPQMHAYSPYMPPAFLPYPHYYDTTADGRTIMMYDQQAFPPYTAPREPSPSESAKFNNVQRSGSGNAQPYAQKYEANNNQQPAQATSPQPNQQPQTQQQQQQQQPNASPHYPYGNPMYGYPPYPSYASYQPPSQYGYGRPYMRYPNFSANSTGFPPAPATTGSPMGTGYPDDMQSAMTLGQDSYKNMSFPPMSGFFPAPDMMGTGMSKNPQQPPQQQQQQPMQQQNAKGGYNANQSSSGNASNSSADLSGNYKVQQQQQQQQQQSSYPGSNSYYGVPQQYGQASQANYPYGGYARQSYDQKY